MRAPKARAEKILSFISRNLQNFNRKLILEAIILKHRIVTHSRTHVFGRASQQNRKQITRAPKARAEKILRISLH